jgi:hypothetical protein
MSDETKTIQAGDEDDVEGHVQRGHGPKAAGDEDDVEGHVQRGHGPKAAGDEDDVEGHGMTSRYGASGRGE